MAFVLPIDALLKEVTPTDPCGVLNDTNQAQIDVLDDAVKRASKIGFHKLRKAAEGLFLGGEIPDLVPLGSDHDGAMIKIEQPVKHLKAAMVLTLTALEMDGLAGFADGVVLIEKLLSTQWDNIHPQANQDDLEDPYARRVNLLSPLSVINPGKIKQQAGPVMTSDAWSFDRRLFGARLLESDRLGAMNLRDAISPWANHRAIPLPRGEDRSPEFVNEVRSGSAAMISRQQEAVQSAIQALERVEQRFKPLPGDFKPNFDYLLHILKTAGEVLDGTIDETRREGENKPVGATESRPAAGDKATGPISNREDVVRKLTEVSDYFRRQEPSSPVPLMLDRVKRLVGVDFIKVMQELDLGEETLTGIRKAAGIREKPPENKT
jgi:type VI secretion system protein ImpA